MAIKDTNLSQRPSTSKCEGIGCAFKTSCGRYLRPAAKHQIWSSFYALQDDDCAYFEAVPKQSVNAL